jgi:hypothetical protein
VVTVDYYGLTSIELQSVGYKDEEWVLANRVAHVAYYTNPKESKRHVVVLGKQRIVGADGVQSLKEYNNYNESSLFTDHPRKIKKVENRLNKTKIKPWFRLDGNTTLLHKYYYIITLQRTTTLLVLHYYELHCSSYYTTSNTTLLHK